MNVQMYLPTHELPSSIIFPTLTHGSHIVTLVSGNEDTRACDALITEQHDLVLGIKTADCAPVCMSDGTKIGIAHIGWRGLCLGLAEKMLAEFDPEKRAVHVGPFLHTFEIQKDSCYERIAQKCGEHFFTHENGRILFHFKDALAVLLPPSTVYDERNTGTDPALPSYRRDKTKERFATVVSFV